MWRLRPTVLLAAAWAWLSVVRVKRRLRSDGVRAQSPRPPALPASAGIGVRAVMTRFSPTCIERALVLQAWLSAHGESREIVVGVPPEGMGSQSAHAWLDGDEPASAARYTEIYRIQPRLRT